ncbi:MAG: SLC13 family permease [Candidatus Paceibacterota bacterium]|jgi:Na+/H+ antiporter NhaD/arsenite permease-like protein
MIETKFLALAIFIITYVLLIIFYNKKSIIVWSAVLAILLTGTLSIKQSLLAINLNVILLYFGMLFISELFLYSKMPDFLAEVFASKATKVWGAMLIICGITGVLSIFLENVAVVLLMAPIALSVATRCNINPVPLFIGMALSSNLQGAATLIGDPPSMLLAGFAKMNFNDFFFVEGKLSIFFAVQIAFIASLVVLFFFFRKNKEKMPELPREKHVTIIPSLLIVLLIVLLVISSSVDTGISYMNGLICFVLGLFACFWYVFHQKRIEKMKDFFIKMDWDTGIFLMGIFILVESISANGILNYVSDFILSIGGGSNFIIFLIIVLVSVILSAFVDNVPFLLAMLPVVQTVTSSIGADPYLFYFALLIGASVGGNITPIGASANIVAMGIMKKKGHNVKFMEFVKIGLSFSVVAVFFACAFLWFVFN